jgi:DNA mismatch endonuclease (patch repair protein)
MARVRGDTDTDIERRLASLLWGRGIRGYRRRCKTHVGRPDFCFHTAAVALFVDGCFWHCCPIHFKLPATRVGFWESKLLANKARDRRQTRQLRRAGWTVIRLWNHDLKTDTGMRRAIERISEALRG